MDDLDVIRQAILNEVEGMALRKPVRLKPKHFMSALPNGKWSILLL